MHNLYVHPCICKIYDIFKFKTDVDLFNMEFLEAISSIFGGTAVSLWVWLVV